MPEPVAYADLERLSDTELVARAREALPEADLETAKRCVALVYERHRMLVRAVCAGKASPQLVDDLEASVYERFVRVAYLAREPIANPAGLLMVMTRRVLASHYARAEPPHTGVDVLGDVAVGDPRGRRGFRRLRGGGGARGAPRPGGRRRRRACGRARAGGSDDRGLPL